MKRIFVLSLPVLALALLAIWWPYLSSQAKVSSPGFTASVKTERTGPHTGNLMVSTAPSPQANGFRYAVEFHNELMPAEGNSQSPGLLIGFSATLTVTPVQEGAQETWSQLLLSNLTPLVDSEGRNWLEGSERAHLEKGLTQAFYLGVGPDGRAERLKLTRKSDALIEGILRLVAQSLQFVRHSAQSYETQELDPVGEARVTYRAVDERRYAKRKVEYLKLLTQEGLRTPREAGLEVQVEGETEVVRDASNRHTVLLSLEEDTSTKLGDATLTNHVELSMRLVDHASASSALQAFRVDRLRPDVDLRSLPAVHVADPERALRELVGDKSAADLLTHARGLSTEDGAARRHVLAQLEASLVLNPEGAHTLAASFREADEREASLVLSALGNAGTAESQHALGELAGDDEIEGGRRESAFALLGMTRAPTQETVEVVREAAKDSQHPNHRTAMLALGNLQQRLSDEEESDRVFEELMRKLQQAATDDERVLCLSALGNTGDARLPARLQPFVTQGVTSVRAEALWALRLVGNAEAFALLAHGAASDPEVVVRQRAIEALRYRPNGDTPKVLTASASTDPEGDVRLSALMVLSALGDPALRELARSIAEREPNDTVREQAMRLFAEG